MIPFDYLRNFCSAKLFILVKMKTLLFCIIYFLNLSNSYKIPSKILFLRNRKNLFSTSVISQVKVAESGAALELKDVNLSIGNNDIITKINWSIMPNERWALVGKNGAGKVIIVINSIIIKYLS